MREDPVESSLLIASLTEGATGRWQITTENGSTYVLDLDQRLITRVPETPTLRRDYEALLLHQLTDARVGASGRFLVQVRADDLPTLRVTSHIISLTKLRA